MCKPSLFRLIVVFHSGFGLTDSYWIVPFYTLRRQVPMRQVEMWLTRHSRKSDGRGSPFSHWGPHFSGKMGTRGPHFYGGPQNFMTPVKVTQDDLWAFAVFINGSCNTVKSASFRYTAHPLGRQGPPTSFEVTCTQ